MDSAVAAKRLTRIQAKLEVMEKLLEDKSRALYIANREVEKTNDHLQNVIGSMLSSLIVTDAEGTIQTANQATLDLLGYTAAELAGQPLAAIDVDRDTIDLSDVDSLVSNNALVRQEINYKTKDGDPVPVLFSSSAMRDGDDKLEGIVCVALDLSNCKMLENQLLQSEKMASVGQLAAGVAHEINNPMGFIFSNLRTLGEYVNDITDLLEAYKGLEESVKAGALEKAQGQLKALNAKKEELDLAYRLDDIDELITASGDLKRKN